MKKINAWMKSKRAKFMTAAMVGATACSGVAAMAVETPTSTITTALTTAAQTMITDSMAMIAGLVPVVVPLIGTGILIAYGIKFIKRITSKA